MIEQLVSLEIAKWLKELGFDEDVNIFGVYNGYTYALPTINQALDWLADVKGIMIDIKCLGIDDKITWKANVIDTYYIEPQKTRKEASKELLKLIYTNKEKLGL